jgi:hypothetical protein
VLSFGGTSIRYEREGYLPEVLYLQIDGGAENANQIMLAICELLIIRGFVREIHICRLPVGHTHEDIDSIFGTIWRYLRSNFALNPVKYKEVR